MMMIPVAAVLCLAIGGPYLWLGYQHYSTYSGVNVGVHSVLLFLCINVVICLWELCLCYKHALIRSTHAKRVKDGQVWDYMHTYIQAAVQSIHSCICTG